MEKSEQICGVCMVLCCFTFVILFFSAFTSLEVNEIGLNYSSISREVQNKTYMAGFHWLGIGHSFIRYPKTVQQYEFSKERNADYTALYSRTSDGNQNEILNFYTRLTPTQIYELFYTYKDQYKQIFLKMAIDVLTDNATGYSAYEFFVDRQKIGNYMQDALNRHFQKVLKNREFNCFSSIEFFQLRSVDLPDQFEDAIQLTEVYKQNIQKAQAQKLKIQVELETQLKSAQYQVNVTSNLAQGDAQVLLREGEAKAKSFLVRQSANSKAYSHLKNKLEMDENQFINYMKSKVIRDYEGNDLLVSFDFPSGN